MIVIGDLTFLIHFLMLFTEHVNPKQSTHLRKYKK